MGIQSRRGKLSLRLTRVNVNIPAVYTLKGSEADAAVVDISSGGVGLEVKQIFVVGDIVRVKFRLTDGRLIDFWGIVKNVSNNFIGIKYEEISNETCKALENYVNELRLKQGIAAREQYDR